MNGTLWIWMLQRISAVLLVLLLGTHFAVMHFVDPTAEISFATSSLRLQGLAYFLVDTGLLALGLFHGFNGIRNIIIDYWPRAERAASWTLTILGLIATGYGALALLAFLNMN